MNRHFNEIGAFYIDDASAHDGIDCYGFQTESDTIIAAITYSPGYSGPDGTEGASTNIVGKTLPAGRLYLLRFESITLTSGTILAYRAS